MKTIYTALSRNSVFGRRFLKAVLMSLMLILSIGSVPASAANTCDMISGTGKIDSSTTFTVTTRSNWWIFKSYLTFKQNGKGTVGYTTRLGGKNKTVKRYACYRIVVKEKSSGKTVIHTTWTGSQKKIKLPKRNCTYTITVTAYFYSNFSVANAYNEHWITTPTWYVKKTSGITMCK